ncbi:MAG: orotidine-5'-phosphate decarboxylase [Actinomycetia bacterium]|nr:orotidine-5'-phosphate decarboxylase [Actinomycetes bacterium]
MPELAVALDTADVDQAAQWAGAVAPHAGLLKLGLEFYLRNGAEGVQTVREQAPACGLFLDLKLHDIPATVAGGARAVAPLDPDYLTVHASGGSDMIAAAAEALPKTRITAVTVLTSLAPSDLSDLGLSGTPAHLAAHWAALAVAAGARAVVSSVLEATAIRSVVGGVVDIVTPGIRPAGSDRQDQARVATPQAALAAGANVLVVGRPITGASDPTAAAAAIASAMA